MSRPRNRRHRAERKAKAEGNDELQFGYWFVAFFDLLHVSGRRSVQLGPQRLAARCAAVLTSVRQ